jgi:hypothetical protein
MKIALLATHTSPAYENLIFSLFTPETLFLKNDSLKNDSLKNDNVTILGNNETWRGWKWRCIKYVDFLSTLENSELVVFCDAFDVLCLNNNMIEFEEKFESFKADIVFSKEWWCGSPKNCGKTRIFDANVNAGFISGRAHALKSMYTEILSKHFVDQNFDDQLEIAHWIDQNLKHTLKIDTDELLCMTIHILDMNVSLRKAHFAHFPGPLLKLGLFPHYDIIGKTLKVPYQINRCSFYIWYFFCILVIAFVLVR